MMSRLIPDPNPNDHVVVGDSGHSPLAVAMSRFSSTRPFLTIWNTSNYFNMSSLFTMIKRPTIHRQLAHSQRTFVRRARDN